MPSCSAEHRDDGDADIQEEGHPIEGAEHREQDVEPAGVFGRVIILPHVRPSRRPVAGVPAMAFPFDH